MDDTDHGPANAPPDTQPTGSGVSDRPTGEGFDSTLDGSNASLPPGLVESAPPRRLGRYVLLEELGAGGMGAVYKAWDPTLDRPVALKMMHAGRVASGRAVRRFLNEARAVARIAHRHIVEIHDMGVVERMPYFTMSLVDGPSLEAWLVANPAPDPQRLCAMLAPVARALGHAHRAGVIHRDIKPANLLVDAGGDVRLVDFGVAQLADDEMTRTGQVIGTPAYMAPEQARGAQDIDVRVDVYGLGGVLYRAVMGAPPPRAIDGPLALPVADRDFRAIVTTALAADPGQRYADADALGADLERFVRGEPVQAALPGRARRLGWWVRRRRVALLAIGGLLVGGLVGLQLMQWWSAREARAARQATEASAERLLIAAGDEIDALRTDGRLDDARARIAAVSQRLDVQGTDALSRFLLDAAGEASVDGRADAPDLLASVYAQSSDPALRRRALIELGRHHRSRAERLELDAVIETLRRRHPADFGSPAVRALRRDAALLGRRPSDAARLLRSDRRAFADLLEALGRTTASALSVGPLPPGAGSPVAAGRWLEDGRRRVQVGFDLAEAHPSLTPVGRLPHPADGRWQGAPRLFVDPEGRPVMLGMVEADGPPRAALYRLAGLDRPPIRLWRAEGTAAIGDALQADLDGGGVAPIYLGYTFDLIALVPDGGDRWRRVDPHPRTPHTGSVVSGLAVTAVDGRPALAVTFAEWLAYDIRLLRPDTDGSRLLLGGRARLGRLAGVVADRQGWLWAHNDGDSINNRAFAEGARPAEPALFGFAPGADLGAPLRIALPAAGRLDAPRAFDLLGDGRTSVAVNRLDGGGALITLDAAGPAPWTIPLPGYTVRGVLDLDGDGDDELIALPTDGGSIRVLGAGHAPLPPLPPSTDQAARTGDRLAELVALGRLRAARDQYRLRVRLGRSAVDAARRAGELGLRLDDPAGAAADFAESARRAARLGRSRAARAGWQAAADAWGRARNTPEQSAALAALVPYLPPQDRDAVDARIAGLAATEPHVAGFGAPLDAAWRVLERDRVTRDAFDARLVVRGRGSDGPLASLSLDGRAPRVMVEGTITLARLDVAGSLHVEIVDGLTDGGALLAGVVVSGELADTPWAAVEAASAGGARPLYRINAELAALGGSPTRFALDIDRARGEAHVVWGEPPTRGGRITLALPPDQPPAGPLTLVIASRPRKSGEDGWLRASFGPLRLTGARPHRVESSASQRARRWLTEGDAGAALQTLDRAGAPAPLDRAAALDALDRFDEADALLAALPPARHAERDQLLRGWMHSQPVEAFARLRRQGLGALAERIFSEVWEHLARIQPGDPTGRAALAAVLPMFDRAAAASDPSRARRLGTLLRIAVAHAMRDGDLRAARRRSDALFAVTGALTRGPGALAFSDLLGLIGRARIAVRAGRPERARGWIRRAIDGYPAPEIAADLVRARPELSSLFEAEAAEPLAIPDRSGDGPPSAIGSGRRVEPGDQRP